MDIVADIFMQLYDQLDEMNAGDSTFLVIATGTE